MKKVRTSTFLTGLGMAAMVAGFALPTFPVYGQTPQTVLTPGTPGTTTVTQTTTMPAPTAANPSPKPTITVQSTVTPVAGQQMTTTTANAQPLIPQDPAAYRNSLPPPKPPAPIQQVSNPNMRPANKDVSDYNNTYPLHSTAQAAPTDPEGYVKSDVTETTAGVTGARSENGGLTSTGMALGR